MKSKIIQIIPAPAGLIAKYREEGDSFFGLPVEVLALTASGDIVGFVCSDGEGFWNSCETDDNFVGYIRR